VYPVDASFVAGAEKNHQLLLVKSIDVKNTVAFLAGIPSEIISKSLTHQKDRCNLKKAGNRIKLPFFPPGGKKS